MFVLVIIFLFSPKTHGTQHEMQSTSETSAVESAIDYIANTEDVEKLILLKRMIEIKLNKKKTTDVQKPFPFAAPEPTGIIGEPEAHKFGRHDKVTSRSCIHKLDST
jgi:hypothetical protein